MRILLSLHSAVEDVRRDGYAELFAHATRDPSRVEDLQPALTSDKGGWPPKHMCTMSP